MMRYIFAIHQAFLHRRQLQCYLHKAALSCNSIVDCDPMLWKSQGICAVILDFNGVLASHDETELPVAVKHWLDHLADIFEGRHLYVLSNKPNKAREQYFQENFPSYCFYRTAYKKPYPHGIMAIIQQAGIMADAVLMVDDRLLTGILAAEIAGVRGLLVTQPFVQFQKRRVKELFFMMLRKIERLVFSC